MNAMNPETPDHAGRQAMRARLKRRQEDAARQAGDRGRLASREAEVERVRTAWQRASRRERVQSLLALGTLGLNRSAHSSVQPCPRGPRHQAPGER